MITDEDSVDSLRETFEQIKWEQNVKAEMSRIEDVTATLFFDFDKNMPERLVEYAIWFESAENITILNREEHAYGTLDNEFAQPLLELISISPLPLTEIIAEEPLIIGHIVELNEEKQIIAVVEDITKQQAIDWKDSQSLDVNWLYLNGTKLDGKFAKGNQVAVWKSGDGPEKTGEIIKQIILLEK